MWILKKACNTYINPGWITLLPTKLERAQFPTHSNTILPCHNNLSAGLLKWRKRIDYMVLQVRFLFAIEKICKVNVTKRRSWWDIFDDQRKIVTLVHKVRFVILRFASVMMLCVVTLGNSQWPEFPIVPNYSTPTFLTQFLLWMKLCGGKKALYLHPLHWNLVPIIPQLICVLRNGLASIHSFLEA